MASSTVPILSRPAANAAALLSFANFSVLVNVPDEGAGAERLDEVAHLLRIDHRSEAFEIDRGPMIIALTNRSNASDIRTCAMRILNIDNPCVPTTSSDV